VYFYSGGASFVSGTHNATSKFALNSNNQHAKGITTDGVSMWVVDDDGSNNRVFKYTVGGAYLGSWAIDPENDKPTGITIDPSGGNSIWIVDQDKDQIFQYDNATGKISGSKTADLVFDLDPDNGKAEGIADPPPRQRASSPGKLTISVPVDLPTAQLTAALPNAASQDVTRAAAEDLMSPDRFLRATTLLRTTARSLDGSSRLRDLARPSQSSTRRSDVLDEYFRGLEEADTEDTILLDRFLETWMDDQGQDA
jgi:hypothetical protein